MRGQRPAFTGIQPLLDHQAGYPPLGKAGPERPILKVIMVHGSAPTCRATARA